MLFCLVLGEEKLKTLITRSELYLIFLSTYSIQGTAKSLVTFIVDHGWMYSPGKSSVMFG